MYKMLIFIKKSEDDVVLDHMRSITLPGLSRLTGQDIKIGDVEGGLLTVEKYYKFCELTFDSAREMNELMQSAEGKQLNRDISSFINFVSVFMVNFSE